MENPIQMDVLGVPPFSETLSCCTKMFAENEEVDKKNTGSFFWNHGNLEGYLYLKSQEFHFEYIAVWKNNRDLPKQRFFT